jgi:hypothetical protein
MAYNEITAIYDKDMVCIALHSELIPMHDRVKGQGWNASVVEGYREFLFLFLLKE